jgi:hypothetical protein
MHGVSAGLCTLTTASDKHLVCLVTLRTSTVLSVARESVSGDGVYMGLHIRVTPESDAVQVVR